MKPYVTSALFLHVPETEDLTGLVSGNPFACGITPVPLQSFLSAPEEYLHLATHVVVAAPLKGVKSVLVLAMQYDFSIGCIPTPSQKDLGSCYGLPLKFEDALELALRDDPQIMDLILCNGEILIFQATIGRLPLIDASTNISVYQKILGGMKRFIGLKLLPFQFVTSDGVKIKTAASGCMIVQHHEHSLASRLISHDSSLVDGMISMVVTAPISLVDYFRFLSQIFRSRTQQKRIATSVGYIKSESIDIETEVPLGVVIDGESVTETPVHCETVPKAIRINIGERLREIAADSKRLKERVDTKNLPAGKELIKAARQKIPFFSYASEERFRDLFISLREDSQIKPTYLVLMVLSTMLAAVGLYQSSSAVVIGAMLLAPLMAPIVALAMGLLRHDTRLSKASLVTIAVGVTIALSAAALISFLFPHKPITMEMQARLNPSILDLAVAIVAGVAGAYTKSHKEILQSLAGVSIAVALVPPLAVAGIGLGMGDLSFFTQAFLLFSTNLIGITLAATFTFRLLGYSPVVRDKKGLYFVLVLLIGITVPLVLSYNELVETNVLEKNWQRERFVVNDKYLIVQQAKVVHQRNEKILYVKVLVRDPLTRSDLNQLRKKIQSNFTDHLVIRVQVIYIP